MKPIISHTFRKLKFADKNKYLIAKLGINESDIRKIRKIKNSEKRFIEAAKLQIETFDNINGDITAWIAGFAGESSVRNIFGSHLNLRKKVMQLPFSNLDYIPFSINDIRRNVRIPSSIDNDVSEEVGIHIGDGSLFTAKDRKWISHDYSLSGNLREELIYYENFIVPLYFKLFNLQPQVRQNKTKNECRVTIKSKAVFYFKNKFLQLPVGEKVTIRVPKSILANREFIKSCLRGMLDTDGSLDVSRKNSLHMTLSTFSKPLFNDLKDIFAMLNFKYAYHKKDAKSLEFSLDTKNSLRYLEEIKSHNISIISKYGVWKEFGYCPFRIHTEERLAVLKGKIDFATLENLSEKRKAPSGGISEL